MASNEERFDKIELALEKISGKLGTVTWILGFLLVVVALPVLRDLLAGIGG